VWIRTSLCLAIGIKGLEILRRADHELFELTLGHVRAGERLQRFDPLVERALGRFDRHAAPHFQRVLLRREIERTIERMQTGCALGSIAGACQVHGAEDAFQAARMYRRGRERRARSILHRFDRMARLAQVEMCLQQFPHQLAPHPLQLPFQFAMLHLPRLLRTQELGDCRIGLVRRGKRISNGTGQRAHSRQRSPRSRASASRPKGQTNTRLGRAPWRRCWRSSRPRPLVSPISTQFAAR